MRPATSPRDNPKQRVLEAVFRLVARGGIAESSLRKVADESGVNIGSVRHYFGSQEGLMVAAAEEVGNRMRRRLTAVLPDEISGLDLNERRALVEDVCRAVLPLTEQDHTEVTVLSELITAARLRPEFRPLARRMGADLREVLQRALRAAEAPDPESATARLASLISGISFELLYPHGGGGVDEAIDVLRGHLAEAIPA